MTGRISETLVILALAACVGACEKAEHNANSPDSLTTAPGTRPDAPEVSYDAPTLDLQASGDSARSEPSPRDTVASRALQGSGWPWTVTEVLRLGAADGVEQEVFGAMVSARLSPHGEILVLDPQASIISVFDGRGAFQRILGGQGQGPGELLNPTAITWDSAGRLWVANAFNGRYTVFDRGGNYLKVVTRPLVGISAKHQIVLTSHGHIIDQGSASGNRIPFLRVDSVGEVVDTLPPIEFEAPRWGSRPMPRDFDRSVLDYLPKVIWSLAPDGTLWLAESGSLRIVQRNLAGDTLRTIEASHRQGSLGMATRERIERELAKLGSEFEYDVEMPIVQSIDVLSDGHVLVGITETVGKGTALFDVFSPDGRYLGPLRLSFAVAPRVTPSIVGDTIVAVTLGEYDVPHVVRAHITR